MNSIRVFAPASVSNVGPGFDVMGFALEDPGDELVLTKKSDPGVTIKTITGDEGRLPTDPRYNTASVAAQKFLSSYKPEQGIELTIHKKMPFGSGLGSSAASAVAAVFGANALLGQPLTKPELIQYALEGEEIASGSKHADNVSPSMLGGFTLTRSYDPLDILQIPFPEDLWVSVIYPHLEINTKSARNLLPKEIPLKDAISQWGNVGSLVAGLIQGDYDLIGRSIVDKVAEPVRSQLIPGFDQTKTAALNAGAIGCSISGSGPSIFALARGSDNMHNIVRVMQKVYAKIGTQTTVFTSAINPEGARILESPNQ